MITAEQAERLARAAYEAGWNDACSDHLRHGSDPKHPVGVSRRPEGIMTRLDPSGLLGVKGKS